MSEHPDYLTEEDEMRVRAAEEAVAGLIEWNKAFVDDEGSDPRRGHYITRQIADLAWATNSAAATAFIALNRREMRDREEAAR